LDKIKKYKMGDKIIKCKILYGFDKELLLNYDDESTILHMFINSKDYDEKWFNENENKNQNIIVMIVDIKDDSEFNILEMIVDKIYELQIDAYNKLKNLEKDYEKITSQDNGR
jgi:spore coat polysaccharide biosynthesis protein SpsF (cytidylyltransferase family)